MKTTTHKLIKTLVIDPAMRRYRTVLEAQIDKEIRAGTFSRDLSAKVDDLLVLLEN